MASVEAKLKVAVQFGWRGCHMGLSQHHSALKDVKDTQQSLASVSKDWRQTINPTGSNKGVKDAVMWHSPLAVAVENLKNISHPKLCGKGRTSLNRRCPCRPPGRGWVWGADESSTTRTGDTSDMTLIHGYFGSMQCLSADLAQQLWGCRQGCWSPSPLTPLCCCLGFHSNQKRRKISTYL